MGIPANSSSSGKPPAGDQANAVVQGTLSAPGQTPFFSFYGPFNVTLWGSFTGSAALERSFDGGTTWLPRTDLPGTAPYTAPASFVIGEPESGVLYRLNATALSAGTLNYRMSATGAAAKAWAVSSAT